ncbi:WGR domain-containing protein [Nocardia beijingensis]|uniref:WGR domain-containing protein n=1 Tax=Nocardia beijingensis TaxID=95162 RepID=UPI0018962E78|nr:WGR domain-containing protein [Nocardia beijingensis]MBF6468888.1 WGR domain-containing protein [Nocardia beijingensis]
MTIGGTTYLELSEDSGTAHKFYEVIVAGTQVSVRFGRIGEQGQTKVSSFASEEKAQAAAAKKVGEKVRKGYAPAVMGARDRRPVTRRAISSGRSTAKAAPVLWSFDSGAAAFGIFVDERRCWVGNESGDVFTLTPDGVVTGRYRLPDSVKCIVADDFWIYAGCDDGRVYDLSGKVPRAAYDIAADVDIYWLDIHDGILGVSDRQGGITVIDYEEESLWTRRSTGDSGWMVRIDTDGVYHGHSAGVTKYDLDSGNAVWHAGTGGDVLFGWQESGAVYAGTARNQVRMVAKSGRAERTYQCDAAVFSCATSPDGRYVFAGDNYSSVYCFAADGTRVWKLATGCGSAYSMQYHDEKLYLVTTTGTLACLDVGEAAIRDAEQGVLPETVSVKAPEISAVVPSSTVEITSDASAGVIVECVHQGSSLRVRVVSPGYHQGWNVQFPKDIRRAGARYVVDGIAESARGGFYRVRGDIRQLS